RVPLPAFLRDELAAYLISRPKAPDALVFTAAQGGPLRHNLFSRRQFKPAALKARLPADCASTTCGIRTPPSASLASTADPYAVMRRMGHSSITVTYNTYGHLFPERDAEITASLEVIRRAGVDSTWTQETSSRRPDATT
ncbi:MAG: hypothetical protein ACRD0D_12290, partial [Acidimicrobiales bacterium]